MKSWIVLLLSVMLTTVAVSARSEEHTSKKALEAANNDVHAAQRDLHIARQNYLNATRTSGHESPQALSAKTRLDAARETWRGKMNNRQELRKHAKRDMLNRRNAPHDLKATR